SSGAAEGKGLSVGTAGLLRPSPPCTTGTRSALCRAQQDQQRVALMIEGVDPIADLYRVELADQLDGVSQWCSVSVHDASSWTWMRRGCRTDIYLVATSCVPRCSSRRPCLRADAHS